MKSQYQAREGRSRGLLLAAALGLLCFSASTLQVQGEERQWSDKSGKFKVKATLLAVEDGKARLKLASGKEAKIEIAKLSPADQKFIEENPPEDEANPFETVEESSGTSNEKSAPAAAGSGAKQVKVDWSNVDVVALTPSQEAWKFNEPVAAEPKAKPKKMGISIPQKANFFEGVTALVVNQPATHGLIGYAMDEPKPNGQTRVVLVDFGQGKVVSKATAPGKMAPVALNDKGTLALMRRAEFGFGNADRMELWKLDASGATTSLVCTPFEDQQGPQRDVKWGAFLEEDRYVLLGGSGRLAVFKANLAEPEYSVQIDGGCTPALSPNRKYLAFSTGQQVGVLDLAAGEVSAVQGTPHTPWPRLCFSPDGSKLACMAHGRLMVWNFADGSIYRDVPLTGLNVGTGEILWPHANYLLLGKAQLFDLENQVPVWSYNGGEVAETVGTGAVAFVVSPHDKPGAVIIGAVPNPAFEAALATAQKQPDFFVFQPGATVKLSVDALPDASEREKVQATLTKKLAERNCKVGPNGSIELVASAAKGEEREISYHGFGVNPWKTHKVREHFTKLALVYQGKPVWQVQGSSVPGFIQLKEGETIDQVLRKSEKPSYQFYDTVELPKALMKPTTSGGLGASQVTVTGVQ